jgi:glycosyltransferase involved in cell wall biosynthesis
MKIAIVVGGRFHAFNLAEQLNYKGYLNQLITSYPKFYIKKNFNISSDKVKTIISKEIFSRIISKNKYLNKMLNIDDFLINYFDKFASKKLDLNNLNILVGWSSFSLESFKKVQNSTCIKILERGSTHIEFQHDILKEEYKLHGIKPKLPSKEIILKEIKEYTMADYICVPSEFVKRTFINKGFNEERIIKIPYGVDLKNFYKFKDKIIKKTFRIICVGTVSIRKGALYLLKAFEELNLYNSELLMIGNIDDDIYPLIKKYYKNKNINFIKPIKQNKLINFYNSSDLFITCSIEEGLSMVQAQAMACGLPVVCTTNTGGDEIIDQNKSGYILPIRNIDILKEKINYFYNNPEIRIVMGKNALEKANNFLSWENYGKKMIKFYNTILN